MFKLITKQILVFGIVGFCSAAIGESLEVGVGIHDITGPAADMPMMGYVKLSQTTAGIHTRLWARAFVFKEIQSTKRVVLVNTDLISIYQGVKQEVVARLQKKFGSLYGEENVLLAASHTHSGPGGFGHSVLYNVVSHGFSAKNFEVVVSGIVLAVEMAHSDVAPALVKVAKEKLLGASRNRSLGAYELNPPAQRAAYADSTDNDMVLLRIERPDGSPVGLLNWFAVHTTSMQSENRLISSDNKGYAAYLFEKMVGAKSGPRFVAGFFNSNAGDVSPNTAGDLNGDRNWDCPLMNSFLCTEESGRKQFEKARALYESANQSLGGTVDYRHQFVDFSSFKVAAEFGEGQARQTCPAAIGISMLAGAEDGVGIGEEGWTCSTIPRPGKILCPKRSDPCQGVKPVVLQLGTQKPYPWTPEVLPIQIIRIGALALAAVPAEFTTMSGRRLRHVVLEALSPHGVNEVVIAGYANAYSGYVATREEYQAQLYEGASTHFGEWTLSAYLQSFQAAALSMAKGTPLPPGPTPRNLAKVQKSVQPVAVFPDFKGTREFGETLTEPAAFARSGDEVSARFWSTNPNHALGQTISFLEVQREEKNGWLPYLDDNDWETRFHWSRIGARGSISKLVWSIPPGTNPGRYRFVHRGYALTIRGNLEPYVGYSRAFEVR